MKKFITIALLIILAIGSIAIYSSCEIKEYTSGDFTYKKFGQKENSYAEITGLSEQGMLKETVIVPKEIDGLPISALTDRYWFYSNGTPQKWASKELEKLYLYKDFYLDNNTFDESINLKEIYIINADEGDFFTSNSITSIYNKNIVIYIYRELYEVRGFNRDDILAANVTYHYNYFASINEGCFWIDNVEIGQKIKNIPPIPTRSPSKSGKKYTFDGWYLEPECINSWDYTVDVMPQLGVLDLYAKWI